MKIKFRIVSFKNKFSMIKFFLLSALIATTIFLSGCSSSNSTSIFSFGVGKYNFTMSDSTGKKLLEGILNVKTYTKDKITGTYDFTEIYNNRFPGFSSMNGEFEGNVNEIEKKVFINTNPKIADSNVFWNLLIKKNSLTGEWNYSTFRGSGTRGKVKVTN